MESERGGRMARSGGGRSGPGGYSERGNYGGNRERGGYNERGNYGGNRERGSYNERGGGRSGPGGYSERGGNTYGQRRPMGPGPSGPGRGPGNPRREGGFGQRPPDRRW
jgi:hypothetical protein